MLRCIIKRAPALAGICNQQHGNEKPPYRRLCFSGEPVSDGMENSEALFMDYEELLTRPDATDTVKSLVRLALSRKPLVTEDDGKGRMVFAAGEDR